MLRNRKHSQAFTLLEVLIVVVIIAVLAALILPSMLDQVNRVKWAEALQMIGAIHRAAETHYGLAGTYSLPSGTLVSNPFTPSKNRGNWSELGLGPVESKNWVYAYHSTEGGTVGYEINVWSEGVELADRSKYYVSIFYSYAFGRNPEILKICGPDDGFFCKNNSWG